MRNTTFGKRLNIPRHLQIPLNFSHHISWIRKVLGQNSRVSTSQGSPDVKSSTPFTVFLWRSSLILPHAAMPIVNRGHTIFGWVTARIHYRQLRYSKQTCLWNQVVEIARESLWSWLSRNKFRVCVGLWNFGFRHIVWVLLNNQISLWVPLRRSGEEFLDLKTISYLYH